MTETGGPIATAVRRLIVATALLYAMLSIVVLVFYLVGRSQRHQIKNEVDRSTRALCTLRSDLRRRRDSSLHFLDAHPLGIPGLGISAAELQKSVNDQSRSISALRFILCPPDGGQR